MDMIGVRLVLLDKLPYSGEVAGIGRHHQGPFQFLLVVVATWDTATLDGLMGFLLDRACLFLSHESLNQSLCILFFIPALT